MVNYGDYLSIEESYEAFSKLRFRVFVQNFYVRGGRNRSLLIYSTDSWTRAVSDIVVTSDGLALLHTPDIKGSSRSKHD